MEMLVAIGMGAVIGLFVDGILAALERHRQVKEISAVTETHVCDTTGSRCWKCEREAGAL